MFSLINDGKFTKLKFMFLCLHILVIFHYNMLQTVVEEEENDKLQKLNYLEFLESLARISDKVSLPDIN